MVRPARLLAPAIVVLLAAGVVPAVLRLRGPGPAADVAGDRSWAVAGSRR